MHTHARPEPPTAKGCFNFLVVLALVHQLALIIPVRDRFGKDVFRAPCLLAFALIAGWAVLAKDVGMVAWLVVWVAYYFKRRGEAHRLERAGEPIHSHHDGDSRVRITADERVAKMYVEPLQLGALSVVLFVLYAESKMNVLGLPLFYLFGVFTLPVCYSVRRAVWDRKVQGMVNARIEQEALMRGFRDRM